MKMKTIKRISRLVKRDIVEGDWVYVNDENNLLLPMKKLYPLNFRIEQHMTLTLTPNTSDLLQILRDNDIKVEIVAMTVCIWKFDYETMKYTSLSGFPIIDNNIKQALQDSIIWLLDEEYIQEVKNDK